MATLSNIYSRVSYWTCQNKECSARYMLERPEGRLHPVRKASWNDHGRAPQMPGFFMFKKTLSISHPYFVVTIRS